LSDIYNARIIQRRSGGGVLILDSRGDGTPSLRGIPLASWYRKVSLSRRKLRIPRRTTLLFILTINNTPNISYEWSCVRVRPLGKHFLIYIFDVKMVGITCSPCICNSRRGKLRFERQWTDSTKKGGTV